MSWLIGKGSATFWIAVALLATGGLIGHRLARDHALARIARQEQRFAAERQKFNEAVITAQQKGRDQERQAAAQFAQIDHQYQQELRHEKAKRLRTLAKLRAARRVYPPVPSAADGHHRLSTASTAARRDHDQESAQLSAAAAEFLVGEASRADQIVRQLTACQKIIQAERTVNDRH